MSIGRVAVEWFMVNLIVCVFFHHEWLQVGV